MTSENELHSVNAVKNHRRDNLNQRQIDVICQETLSKLKKQDPADIGVIAPYNDQVNALKAQLGIAVIVYQVERLAVKHSLSVR